MRAARNQARTMGGRPVPSWLAGKAAVANVPPPIKGWNARDSLGSLDPQDAFKLDNFLSDATGIYPRHGRKTHATGITGNFVETLMEYNTGGATPILFGAGPNDIFDVTASGAVGSASLSSLSNGRWQSTMFATAGGDFLVICNGADSVRNFDGSSWTTPTINNVTSSTLINVCAHKSRLWFIQSGTLKVWYLPALSIAGDATAINLASECTRGGQLMAMASWTRDGGSGMDDVAVFVTSKGEALMYQGNDPASASTWSLIGRYDIPPPIGRRCFIKLGADLCYLSTIGLLPFPALLGHTAAQTADVAMTSKVTGAFQDAFAASGTNYGWQVLEYPKRGLLFLNIPVSERATSYQYVMNMHTGAWCRFTGINAGCMGILGDDLFFGGVVGQTYKYGINTVFDDDGEPISALLIPSFQAFGTGARKRFTMVKPLVTAPTGYVPQVRILTDYNTNVPTSTPASFSATGPYWGTILWGTSLWGAGQRAQAKWQSVTGIGTVGAITFAVNTTRKIIYNGADVMFESGGPL